MNDFSSSDSLNFSKNSDDWTASNDAIKDEQIRRLKQENQELITKNCNLEVQIQQALEISNHNSFMNEKINKLTEENRILRQKNQDLETRFDLVSTQLKEYKTKVDLERQKTA